MAKRNSMPTQADDMTASLRGELRTDEPMARHCSWRCGGNAKRYFMPVDVADIQTLLQQLPQDEAILWLGLGSNLLVRDGGFDGTVIATQNAMNQLELKADNIVYAGAGVSDARLARFSTRQNLTGGEFFAGIPGLVGGALAMNAGAFGGETWRQVLSVETLSRDGRLHTREPNEYEVSYRHVALKNSLRQEWFIAASFQFARQAEVAANDVLDIKHYLAKRAATQPTGSASCGSVFRNPENDFAARLIDACGLKNTRIGGAVISEKHANFIINDQSASAADIEQLIELAQQTVYDRHGIALQAEVRIVGNKAS